METMETQEKTNIKDLPIQEILKKNLGSVKITLKPYEILLFTLTLALTLFIGVLLFFNIRENPYWEHMIIPVGYLIMIYGIFGSIANILNKMKRVSYSDYQNSVRVSRFNRFMFFSTPTLIFGAMIIIIGICVNDLPLDIWSKLH